MLIDCLCEANSKLLEIKKKQSLNQTKTVTQIARLVSVLFTNIRFYARNHKKKQLWEIFRNSMKEIKCGCFD